MRALPVVSAVCSSLLIPGVWIQSSWGQEGKQLSAREIFYSAPKVAAKRPQKAKVPTPPRPEPAASSVSEVEDVVTASSVSNPPAVPVAEPPPVPASIPTPAQPDQPQFIPASMEETAPIGLRCSVLKRVGPSDLIEVDPDMVFRSGERIRIRVEANDTGYLYIVHRGSSGVWKPLFPSPEMADGSNLIEAGRQYDLPPGHVFTFDEQAGVEKLFVVFSRHPVNDLESLIYDLGNQQTTTPTTTPKPASKTKVLLAQNMVSIGDDLVENMRTAYARDLIIEKVDDKAEGADQETAVYVVTSSTESDSRVVVDLNLMHR
jgi:hypothetical protein